MVHDVSVYGFFRLDLADTVDVRFGGADLPGIGWTMDWAALRFLDLRPCPGNPCPRGPMDRFNTTLTRGSSVIPAWTA